MSENSIHQVPETDNSLEPDPATYTEIAQLVWSGPLTISEQDNPHRLVAHPSGWQFHIEAGLVFAHSPIGNDYLLDGVPARTIIEALTVCTDCAQQANIYVPDVGMVCYSCLRPYVNSLLEPDHAKS